ncbi:LuxR family transcriptional regulator [Streptomyces sp. ODS05-4]|uniref:helix-turn-helix transcriptional regulator n=1 Tax=Streptomyces sp. ODS05-4 TaxID=2944939 RepID=UPI00210B77EA|nr:LuxR family transcriptional regulator [Streptomyces sp. ODS05-4]
MTAQSIGSPLDLDDVATARWSVLNRRAAESPSAAGVLVGREGETRALEAFVDDALGHGHGAVLLVTGPPGAGKTQLVRKALVPFRQRGVRVRWARPPFLHEAGAPVRRQAGVHVVDDVHRLGGTSAHDLIHAVEEFQNQGGVNLLIADDTVRSEAVEEMGRLGASRPLRLGELAPGAALGMIGDRLPNRLRHRDMVAAVHEWCGGNPLLIEEMSEHLARLPADDVLPLSSRCLPPVPAPLRVREAARLAGLDPVARRMVHAAALVGPGFSWRAVRIVTDEDAERVHEGLRCAADAGILRADASGPARYRFPHPVIAAALCAEAQAHEGAAIVTAAADLLAATAREALDEGDLDGAQRAVERAWWLLAEQPERRARLAVLVLRVLSRTGDMAAVARTGAVRHLASSGEATDPAVVRVLAAVSRLTGETMPPARDLGPLGEDRGGTHHAAADLALVAAEQALAAGRGDLARAHARRAATAASDLARPEALCDALDLLGQAGLGQDTAFARRAYGRARRVAITHRLHHWVVRSQVGLGNAALLDRALTEPLHTARRAAEAGGAAGAVANVDVSLGWFAVLTGEFEQAATLARDTGRTARTLGSTVLARRADALASAAHALACPETGAAPDASDDPAAGVMRLLLAFDLEACADELALWSQPHSRRGGVCEGLAFPWHGLRTLLDTVLGRTGAPVREPVSSFADRGLGLYAEAVRAGRRGEHARAERAIRHAERLLCHSDWLRHLARLYVARAAVEDGWGDPAAWLHQGVIRFSFWRQRSLAHAARTLLRGTGAPVPRQGRGVSEVPAHLASKGVTSREMDVLLLVTQQMRNKDIARRLMISPRTVETHVSSLFAKTHSSDRHELAALLERSHG